MQRVGDLEVHENVPFQHAWWRWRLLGQGMVVLFVVAGLTGLFGGGVVGDTTVQDTTRRISVEHPRFLRLDAASELVVKFDPSLVRHDGIAVWLGTSLLHQVRIDSVAPEPAAVELEGERMTYRFAVHGPATRGPIVFYLRSRRAGAGQGRVGVVGGPEVTLGYLVYP